MLTDDRIRDEIADTLIFVGEQYQRHPEQGRKREPVDDPQQVPQGRRSDRTVRPAGRDDDESNRYFQA
nr:hypothetical protein [Natrinema sp. SYSU A 869]